MLLLIHIITAISSIVFSTFLVLSPTVFKLKASYGLIVGSLASGTLLIMAHSASILRTCLAGLVYTAIAFGLTSLARHKLAAQESRDI